MTIINRTPCPPKERMEGTLRCHSPGVTTGLTSSLSQSVVVSKFENVVNFFSTGPPGFFRGP